MAQKKKKKLSESVHSTVEALHAKKGAVMTVYIVLRLAVILVMVAQFLNGNFENVFLCVLTLILFLIPTFIERKIHVDLPDTLEIIIMLFIFAAEILGEIQAYYITFPYWDTMLHTLNGFLAITAFCFSMTIGVLWEFFECIMDQFFLLDMQKDTIINTISSVRLDPTGGNHPTIIRDITDVIVVTADGAKQALGLGGYLDVGILDTMKDLFVNFIGAVVFSVIGYVYVKTRGEGRFARRFIPQVVHSNEGKPEETEQSAE